MTMEMGWFGLVVPILIVGLFCLGIIGVERWSRGVERDLSAELSFAQERAEAILRELLTAQEYEQLGRFQYLVVPSGTRPGRTYRVPRGAGRVAVLDNNV